MQALVKKSVIAASIAAATLFAGSASAAQFNPFTVNSAGVDTGSTYEQFTADKITGNYVEVISFNGKGGFDVSLKWDAGQFVTNGGKTQVLDTGLGARDGFGLYALYKASGTVNTTGGVTTFNFTQGSGNLSLYLDKDRNTKDNGTTPTSGTGNFALTGTADDVMLASGDPLSGLGTLDPSLSTCGNGGINCGSFGSTTSFNLTSDGKLFFVAPNPFYNLSFQSGQLNNFNPTGNQIINGSLDVVFSGNAVPEPASLGLLGLGLLGLGAARRRKQKQA